jgi:DNA topoisomerase-1
MSKHLVIVESPAKAKTIEKFLGKDYIVQASFGHVRDLPKSGMAIDIEHNFAPNYEVSPDKKKRIAELKKLVKAADTVWLASDEDREGEAIAWHLEQALKLPDDTKRIVFHEITESAIKKALSTPRVVDSHLVDAQQARRVLDRLVGYELSPVLWKKVQRGLSAGRVQSVAVRLIVEREVEIEGFEAKSSFKITAEFPLEDGAVLKAELPTKLKSEDEAKAFLESCVGADFKLESLETKPGKRSPAAPFTTSTLQQEASRKLGFSVRQTMSVAQRLYEQGHITYMRTDSVHLSDLAIAEAKAAITKQDGANYVQTRQFTTKSAGAQEAHEAIRPTRFDLPEVAGERNEQRLYELIWKRAIASQMAEAQLERTTASVAISTRKEKLVAKGEVVTFDGFLKVYLESHDDDERDESNLLPPLKEGQALTLATMSADETFDRPKPRFTEASLVKQLEELGIGRPSTYAPTISTIQDRGYVEKGDLEGKERSARHLKLVAAKIEADTTTENYGADRSKLFPTDVGRLVNDFLVNYFPNVVDVTFTARIEEQFDDIAEGEKPWQEVISDFYGPFHETVVAAEGISRQEASGARELGNDPKTGKPIVARLGRFGPMLQLGSAEDEEKPKFAPLPTGRKIGDVTLEEALELFKLPRSIGKTKDGQDIAANFGRFGPYIKWGSLYASIKPDDPFTVTHERALELIAEKELAEANKYVKQFEGSKIAVLNGRYGPYISDGTKNAKIPKEVKPEDLTLEQCQELLAAAPTRKKKRIVKRPQ